MEYLELARSINSVRVDQIITELVPKALWEYGVYTLSDPTYQHTDISWKTDPNRWEAARAELADIIASNNVALPNIRLAVSPASVQENGTANLVYTFRRTGATTSPLTVNYSVAGTATLGTDYTGILSSGTTKTVTFAAGSETAIVTVNPTGDTTVEPDEAVVFTLVSSGTGYTIATTSPVIGTITNDDVALHSINLNINLASVQEDGTSNLIYTFTRTGSTTNTLTVNYCVTGTASNNDYTGTTMGANNVTFAAGSSTAIVTVDPTGDTTVESDETVALNLASGTGYTIGTTTAVTGTILNDDTSITLAVSPSSVTEDGTTNMVYTFTRTGVTTNALTVNYAVGGTATFNNDYTQTGAASFSSTAGTISFAAGQITRSITIDPTADTIVEPNETVALTLATGTGYTIATTTAVTGTIANDDVALPSITLAVSPASVQENGTPNLVYTFRRTGATTSALTVNYRVAGTATNTDYTGTTTGTGKTVTFAAGSATAIVTVNPTGDSTVEPNETVALTLASGTGYAVGTTTAVTGTIANDDFTGDNTNNILNGTAGNDILSGLAGNDTLNGGGGIDILIGGLGNDTYVVDTVTDVITELSSEGTDTIESSVTFSLANLAQIENLTLTGTGNLNGTGNTQNNVMRGNSGNNILNGGAGIDQLTGGLGSDRFVFQFGQSVVSAIDRITDFAISSDKIDLLTQGGLAMAAPTSLSRSANSSATSVSSAVSQVFADANGALSGAQPLGLNSAALMVISTASIAGTYLVVNDSISGFQSNTDLVVNLTGYTGTLPNFGTISVTNFFI